ncbi:MAG: hypothetical protein R2800_03395 [Flavipsychrobacter sp.]
MDVTEIHIAGFQKQYYLLEGKNIAKDAAYALLIRLLTVVDTVYAPLTADDIKLVHTHRKELGLSPIDENLYKTIE